MALYLVCLKIMALKKIKFIKYNFILIIKMGLFNHKVTSESSYAQWFRGTKRGDEKQRKREKFINKHVIPTYKQLNLINGGNT